MEDVELDERRFNEYQKHFIDILIDRVVKNDEKLQGASLQLLFKELEKIQKYLPEDVRKEFNTKMVTLLTSTAAIGFVKSYNLCLRACIEVTEDKIKPEEAVLRAMYKILEFTVVEKKYLRKLEDEFMALMRDSGFSVREIGRVTGKSKSSVHERLKKLEAVSNE